MRRRRRILPAALVRAARPAPSRRLAASCRSASGAPFRGDPRERAATSQNWQLATRLELPRRADPVDAGPALLVAVGRGAVLPRVAAADHRRRSGSRRASAGVALGRGRRACSAAVTVASFVHWHRRSRRRTTTSPTSRRSRGRGSSASAACWRCVAARVARSGCGAARRRSRGSASWLDRRRGVVTFTDHDALPGRDRRWCRCSAPPPSSGRGCRGAPGRPRRSLAPAARAVVRRHLVLALPLALADHHVRRRTSPGGRARRRLWCSCVGARRSSSPAPQALDRGSVPHVRPGERCGCRAPAHRGRRAAPPWPPSCSLTSWVAATPDREAGARCAGTTDGGERRRPDGRAVDGRRQLDDSVDVRCHGASAVDGLGHDDEQLARARRARATTGRAGTPRSIAASSGCVVRRTCRAPTRCSGEVLAEAPRASRGRR